MNMNFIEEDISSIIPDELRNDLESNADLVKANIVIASRIFVLPWALSPTKIFIFLSKEIICFE